MGTEVEFQPREFVGYGRCAPNPRWPNDSKVAVQFVLNYEEGGERCVLEGDPTSETFLSEIVGAGEVPGRHMSMESLFEYGSRAGVWRVLRVFERMRLPLTVFAVGRALEHNQEVAAAFGESGHEIACHGYRWINYQDVDQTVEREHINRAFEIVQKITGKTPVGWYTGRDSPNTRRLVVEHGGFVYDSDSYADDLPYWTVVTGKKHLVIPYSLDTNDMRCLTVQGFNTGEQLFTYLKDTFDALYAEGAETPKMMSVGLHARIIGRPGRIGALERFIEHVAQHEKVWICRRSDIAAHWIREFATDQVGERASRGKAFDVPNDGRVP